MISHAGDCCASQLQSIPEPVVFGWASRPFSTCPANARIDSPEDPRFPLLASHLPAVNWQEREIQDWFGVEAVRHPNSRRVALHDHWPDVHPLRKDFSLHTVLLPFEGERHVYRPTLADTQVGDQDSARTG